MNENSRAKVCILAAGGGSRMGDLCRHLHKALLPLAGEAVISQIIERFPVQTEFVIALGNRAQQVRTYVELAHPHLSVEFVEVDKFSGPGSGPGYSLLCCRNKLPGAFYFVSCDTLWTLPETLPEDRDWFGVAYIGREHASSYCNFELSSDRLIEAISDKCLPKHNSFASFVGLCFIKNSEYFWRGLASESTIAGERQISNGIQELVREKLAHILEVAWTDVGDQEKYLAEAARRELYDFSKPEEALYIVDQQVVKFFADPRVSEKRVARARIKPQVFPQVSESRDGFYSYRLIEGKTLYAHCTDEIFERLLAWLQSSVWQEIPVEAPTFSAACDTFYRKKTLERLNLYLKKYPESLKLRRINGELIEPPEKLFGNIPWPWVCQGVSSFFHGDLQFDNIIYNAESACFTLIDWRQDFAGSIEFGDRDYDLAKLFGGIILNYDYIKRGLFSYQEGADGSEAFLDFAQRASGSRYLKFLQDFISLRADLKKIRLMVAIVYLNMAPLHHYPFDKFLFALGCSLLNRELSAHD